MRSSISVLVVDDHPIVRDGVRCLLEGCDDMEIVGEVGDADAAIQSASQLHPQIVIMDISLPGMNGIECTRLLSEQTPDCRVVILSMHASPLIVRRAVEAGAQGYIAKDVHSEELVRAIRAVAAGQRYLGQGLWQGLLDGPRLPRAGDTPLELLTGTERHILQLVAEGQSNREVADNIGLSPRTVETYRLRLMGKLGLTSLPALVRYALRHGLITLD
jgi:DNA-binding NarL/FixJ family response regulator